MWRNIAYINGVHVSNPGSISQSRSSMEETYAEVIIDDQTLHGTISISKMDVQTISKILLLNRSSYGFF